MGTTKTRLDHIDSLRGLAALSVVIQHIFGYLHKADLASAGLFPELQFAMFEGLDLGRYGVVLFFLVSGFIIPFSLNKNSSLAKFSISRFFRLYPAYWAAILLTVILSPWLSENVFSPVQIAYNLTMVPRLLGEDMINGIYWTLFVELVFYALCALLFKLGQLENTILIGLVALGFNLATTVPITLKYADVVHFPIQFLSLHLSFLFLGSLLRLALVKNNMMAKRFSLLFVGVSLFSIPLSAGLFFPVQESARAGFVVFSASGVTVAYFAAIATFVLALKFQQPQHGVTVGLGKISYSLYLLHWLCCLVFIQYLPPVTAATQAIFIVGSLLLSISVSYLSYKFVESPAIAMGRKLSGAM